jgi:hypothetical protein
MDPSFPIDIADNCPFGTYNIPFGIFNTADGVGLGVCHFLLPLLNVQLKLIVCRP